MPKRAVDRGCQVRPEIAEHLLSDALHRGHQLVDQLAAVIGQGECVRVARARGDLADQTFFQKLGCQGADGLWRDLDVACELGSAHARTPREVYEGYELPRCDISLVERAVDPTF